MDKKLFFLFIDGLGLGPDDNSRNPTLLSEPPLFSGLTGIKLVVTEQVNFFDNGVLIPADATLDTPGLPQSATGQTSIFTGINAAKVLGRHLNAFPNKTLIQIIEERSLMKVLEENGLRVTSANLYSKDFFYKRRYSKRNLFPVSTLTIAASNAGFRYISDYRQRKAVFADIINEYANLRGYELKLITPEEAAQNMFNIIKDYNFTFFEYFLTDLYGHRKDKDKLIKICDVLNRFITHLWNLIDIETTSILIVSDHGNAEDISVRTHTLNKVPVLLFSKEKRSIDLFSENIKSITDIYYSVLNFFGIR